MPLIGHSSTESTEEQNQITGTNFGYSAATITHLEEAGTTEYTLATIIVDVSASVSPFKDEMELALKAAITSWKRHPRSEYLLVRFITFADSVVEEHGFRLLADCDPDSYIGTLRPNGMTAMYEGAIDGIGAARDYAIRLFDRDFLVNAITVVIGDGLDNRGAQAGITVSDVKENIEAMMVTEALESHVGILIGVNVTNPEVRTFLERFQKEGGFDQYVELKDANPDTLTKLGNFLAASVSSQSAALGSGPGGASQPLSF